MTFNEYLKKWNGGVMRGAQTKLAKRIHVVPSTIAHWVRGSSMPNEDVRQRVAKEFGISPDNLMSSFSSAEMPGGVVRSGEQMRPTPPNLILGRLEQLTFQIAQLQGQCAIISRDFEEVKGRLNAVEQTSKKTPPSKPSGERSAATRG